MSILDVVADKPLAPNQNDLEQTIFVFPQAELESERTSQDIKNAIHKKLGLRIIDPSTLSPDKFLQDYHHILPEGFTFNRNKVKEVRVREYEHETSFRIVPFPEVEIGPFHFRISKNHSNHHLIPPELLLSQESAQ